jgi:hypothetical protein
MSHSVSSQVYVLVIELLRPRCIHPKLLILGSEASKILLEYIINDDIDCLPAPPHKHRRDAAGRATSRNKDRLVRD